MLSTILVPLDGSETAERALPIAERLAHAISAQMVLVRAVQVYVPSDVDAKATREAAISEAQHYLQGHALRLRNAGGRVDIAVSEGDAATEILNAIDSRRVDLVVMTTHGRSAGVNWLFGSVAAEVLRRSPVPVELVPAGAPHVWPMDEWPTILVPLDGSELAEAALDSATQLSRQVGARLILLQVVTSTAAGLAMRPGEQAPDLRSAEQLQAREYLTHVVRRIDPTVRRLVVRVELGYPASTIPQIAILGAITGGIFNMDMRGAESTPRGALHPVMTAVMSIPIVLSLIFGAFLHGWRFGLLSLATLVAAAVGGMLTAQDVPLLAANLPTPWMGLKERINIYAYMLWVAALALSLWPRRGASSPREGNPTAIAGRAPR